MSTILEIVDDSHLKNIMDSHYNLVVIDIYADWCAPCKYLSPKFIELAEQYQNSSVLFCKLNQNLQLKTVSGLPTIEFWQKKVNSPERELIHTILGVNLQEIKQVLSMHAQPTHIQSTALPQLYQQPSSQSEQPQHSETVKKNYHDRNNNREKKRLYPNYINNHLLNQNNLIDRKQ